MDAPTPPPPKKMHIFFHRCRNLSAGPFSFTDTSLKPKRSKRCLSDSSPRLATAKAPVFSGILVPLPMQILDSLWAHHSDKHRLENTIVTPWGNPSGTQKLEVLKLMVDGRGASCEMFHLGHLKTVILTPVGCPNLPRSAPSKKKGFGHARTLKNTVQLLCIAQRVPCDLTKQFIVHWCVVHARPYKKCEQALRMLAERSIST